MKSRAFALAITKRTANLCATQAILHEQGIDLLTATSMSVGLSAIHRMGVDAVIICRHSWTVEERDILFAELSRVRPSLKFVMRCPGCTESDEAAGIAGRLPDESPVQELVSAVAPGASAINGPDLP